MMRIQGRDVRTLYRNNISTIIFYGTIIEGIIMSFEQQIQKWVAIDNELKEASDKVSELRDERNCLRDSILEYVGQNQLKNATVKLGDGRLRFVETNVSSSLTYKHLEKCLSEIIKNESQVSQIIDYVKRNREVKTVPEIKRFYNN
jgi:hypothetical protein